MIKTEESIKKKHDKLVSSMQARTVNSYSKNQENRIPFILKNNDEMLSKKGMLHNEQCFISPVDRYHYLDKWHMYKYSVEQPEKTIGILKVENLPYNPFSELVDKESFVASIDSILINKYCINFLLFIDNKFVDWNDMELVYDAGKTFLILHGEKYNIYNLRKVKSFNLMVLPFNIDYIGTEDDDSFNNHFKALENFLNDDADKKGYSRINVPVHNTIHYYNGYSYSLGAWIFRQHKYNKLGMLSEDRKAILSNISIMKYKYDGNGKVIDSKVTRFNALDEDSINQSIFSNYCVYDTKEEYDKHKIFSFNNNGELDPKGENSVYITPANRIGFNKLESSNKVIYTENDNIGRALLYDNHIIFKNGMLTNHNDFTLEPICGLGRYLNPKNDKVTIYTFYHKDSTNPYTIPYEKFNMEYYRAKMKYLFNVDNMKSLALIKEKIKNGTYIPMGEEEEDYYTEEVVSTGLYKLSIDLEGNVSGSIISYDDIPEKDRNHGVYGILLIDTTNVSNDAELDINNIENYIGNNINNLYEKFTGYIFRAGIDGDVRVYKNGTDTLFGVDSKHILSEDIDVPLSGRLFVIDNKLFTLPTEIISSLFALIMNDDGTFTGKRIDLLETKGLDNSIGLDSKYLKILEYVGKANRFLSYEFKDNKLYNENIVDGTTAIDKYDATIYNPIIDTDIECFSIDPLEANESLEITFRDYNIRGLKIPRGKWKDHETYCMIFLNGELIENYSDLIAYHDYFILPMEYDFKPTDEIEIMHFKECNNNEIEFNLSTELLNKRFHIEEYDRDISENANPDTFVAYNIDGDIVDPRKNGYAKAYRITTDIFHEFIDSSDLKIFAKYPENLLIYKDLIDKSDDIAFKVSLIDDRETKNGYERTPYIYPKAIVPANRNKPFYAVASNKFVYQRLYPTERSYRFKLDKRFRFCDDFTHYMVFINGRRIYEESFFITAPEYRSPFWGNYLYLTRFVTENDRLEVFYLPSKVVLDNKDDVVSNLKLEENGYITPIANKSRVALDPRFYILFANGKKIPNKDLIPVGCSRMRLTKDIRTTAPLVTMCTVSRNYYHKLDFDNEVNNCTYEQVIDYIDETSILGKKELDNLFSTWVQISNTEDNMLAQSVGRIAVLNEIVRDFWVSSGYEYNKDKWFSYNYSIIKEYMGNPISYEDRVLLPALDANQNINIRKEDARLLYFIAEASEKGFFERGSKVEFIKFLWEYANSIYKDDHNISVVSQDINGVDIPTNERTYTWNGPITDNTRFTFTGNVGYKLLQAKYDLRFVDPIYYGIMDEDTFEHYRKNSLISISELIALVPRNGKMPTTKELELYQRLGYKEKDLKKRFRIFRNLIYLMGDMVLDMTLNYILMDELVAIIPEDSNELMNGVMDKIAEEGLKPVLDRYKHIWLKDCMLIDTKNDPVVFIKTLKALIYNNTEDLLKLKQKAKSNRNTILFEDEVTKISANVFKVDDIESNKTLSPLFSFYQSMEDISFGTTGKIVEYKDNKVSELFDNTFGKDLPAGADPFVSNDLLKVLTDQNKYNELINNNPKFKEAGVEAYTKAIEQLKQTGPGGLIWSPKLNKKYTVQNKEPDKVLNMKPFILIYDKNSNPILGDDFKTIYEAPDAFLEKYFKAYPEYKNLKYKKGIDAYTGTIIYILENGKIIDPSKVNFNNIGGGNSGSSGNPSNPSNPIISDLPTVKLDELRARFNILGGSEHGKIIYGDESQIYIANKMMAVLLNPDSSMVHMSIEHRAFVNATPNELDRARVMRIDTDPNLYALVEGKARKKIYADFKITDVNTKDLIFTNKELKNVIAHIDKHLQDGPDVDLRYQMGNHNYFIYAIPKYMGFDKYDRSRMNFEMQDLKDKDLIRNSYRDNTSPLYTNGDIGDNGLLEPLPDMRMQYMGETDFTSEYGITLRYCIWRTNGFFVKLNPKFGVKIKAFKSA